MLDNGLATVLILFCWILNVVAGDGLPASGRQPEYLLGRIQLAEYFRRDNEY